MADDEQVWKRRFLIFMAVRLFGVGCFLFGIAIIFSDLVQPGGAPVLGVVVAMLGMADALFAPRMLKALWTRP